MGIDPFEGIVVIGGGAWGTALAIAAERTGRPTRLWIRERDALERVRQDRINPFLPAHRLPESIAADDDLARLLTPRRATDLVLVVVPSQHLRSTVRRLAPLLAPGTPLVICSKGIERDSGLLMSQVASAELPRWPLAVLSGPSFADEVAAGQPTAITIADVRGSQAELAAPDGLAARIAVTLGSARFRPYLSDDAIGVEIGGAVKNVLAIACGIAAGVGLGSNPRAALITRGLAEIKRLTAALGGNPDTTTGLAGIGDLVLTCSSEQSRNFSFGKQLGTGVSAERALANRLDVVEGAVNARSVLALAKRVDVEMPICETVDAIVHRGAPIDEAIERLLTRPIRAEATTLEDRIRLTHPAIASVADVSATEQAANSGSTGHRIQVTAP